MKTNVRCWWMILVLAAAVVALPGCKKSDGVDTAKLESSFQSSEPATKSNVDQAVAAVKSGDYATAMAALQKTASQAKLTPEQQQAIKDVIAQVQAKLGDTMKKAADEGAKAMDDLKKTLPKP